MNYKWGLGFRLRSSIDQPVKGVFGIFIIGGWGWCFMSIESEENHTFSAWDIFFSPVFAWDDVAEFHFVLKRNVLVCVCPDVAFNLISSDLGGCIYNLPVDLDPFSFALPLQFLDGSNHLDYLVFEVPGLHSVLCGNLLCLERAAYRCKNELYLLVVEATARCLLFWGEKFSHQNIICRFDQQKSLNTPSWN